MKFFCSPNCSCDYRQINRRCRCPQPAPTGWHRKWCDPCRSDIDRPQRGECLTYWRRLSISLAGWLCPVIVMLSRRWHLCYVHGKCLSNHLLVAWFEFSSTLMDSSPTILIRRMKSSLTVNAMAVATPRRRPAELVTKAVDGHTASPSGPLPFCCCAAAQRLNLLTFLIVLKGPGERPCPFSALNTLCPPLYSGSGAYIHVRKQQHFTIKCVCFFMAEPASLKPQHLYWPSSHFSPLSLSLSHPPLFPCLKQYSLPVVIDSRRLGPSKCSFESGVILSNCSNSRWQGWEGFGGL